LLLFDIVFYSDAENKIWDLEGFATCLAIAFLKTILSLLKDRWELMCLKSKKWLAKEFSKNLNEMEEEAQKRMRVVVSL